MSTTKNPTKREMFTALKAVPAIAANDAFVAFIDHELELLDKKNATSKKPTAKQTAAASLREQIVSEMEQGVAYTVSDAMKSLPCLSSDPDMSNQRASRLLNDLVKEGHVVKTTDKRKSYFTVAVA